MAKISSTTPSRALTFSPDHGHDDEKDFCSTVYSVFRNPNQTLTNIQWTGCFIVFAFLGMETAEKVHRNRNINAARSGQARGEARARIIVRERERERERDTRKNNNTNDNNDTNNTVCVIKK